MGSVFLVAYNLAWSVALPFLACSSRLRQGWGQRVFPSRFRRRADLWIQASSAGEAYLATQLIESCPELNKKRVLITCSTTQGLEVLNKTLRPQGGQLQVNQVELGYFPFDMPFIMGKALENITPKAVVILETELWPGLLGQCKKQDIPVLLINGRLSERSYRRYMGFVSLWRRYAPSKILAVSEQDAQRFKNLYPQVSVDVMRNMKFDRISFKSRQAHKIKPKFLEGVATRTFVVLASIRKEEEADILEAIRGLYLKTPDVVIGLFPRHMHRVKAWVKLLKSEGIGFVLRSQTSSLDHPGMVILWDVFGELADIYGVATAVFVGGTLRPCGGQNFLEPLGSGLVPCIGPYWDNFAWVGKEIIRSGLVTEVRDVRELVDALMNEMQRKRDREEVMRKAAKYIGERQGGTERACKEILGLLAAGTTRATSVKGAS